MSTRLDHADAYKRFEERLSALRTRAAGAIIDATDLDVSLDGRQCVFTGARGGGENGDQSLICQADFASGAIKPLTSGACNARLPRYAPDGRTIAFVTDRSGEGDYQLSLLCDGDIIDAPPLAEGWIEYVRWSRDGGRILLGITPHGADIAAGQGGVGTQASVRTASWAPRVDARQSEHGARRLYLYSLREQRYQPISPPELNIWEAEWCGQHIAAIASEMREGASEDAWYRSALYLIDPGDGGARLLYKPPFQIGVLAASPSGAHVSFVQSLCSDRGLVAGELSLISIANGGATQAEIPLDVSSCVWRNEDTLLCGGHDRLASVAGLYDLKGRAFEEIWRSEESSSGGFHFDLDAADPREWAYIAEGFFSPPSIRRMRGEVCVAEISLDLENDAFDCRAEPLGWQAEDGAQIHGWLLSPCSGRARGLVMNMHGGPVCCWHPIWLARRHVHIIALLDAGYRVFLPNPRGSTGQSSSFVHALVGDVGGVDARDCHAGLDMLVRRGSAHEGWLALIGGSYAGFLTSWMITQSDRFAAAVSYAPINNWVSQRLTSNIPSFVDLFLPVRGDPVFERMQRSPVTHAHAVATPIMHVCGALDKCTPSSEAAQFHAALNAQVPSQLITYPLEGHGVRQRPAMIDFAVRVTRWFDAHVGSPPVPDTTP